MNHSSTPLPTLLDAVLPSYDVHSRYELRVDAAPEESYRAVLETTVREVRLLRPLMALRELPAWLAGKVSARHPGSAVIAGLEQNGFVRVAEEPGREIVLGVVGKFWKLTDNSPLETVRDRDDFVSFAEPGYAKAAMSFLVLEEGAGSRLITETRVVGTDPESSRRFGGYWRWIKGGSGVIRRSWLAAIRRRLSSQANAGAADASAL